MGHISKVCVTRNDYFERSRNQGKWRSQEFRFGWKMSENHWKCNFEKFEKTGNGQEITESSGKYTGNRRSFVEKDARKSSVEDLSTKKKLSDEKSGETEDVKTNSVKDSRNHERFMEVQVENKILKIKVDTEASTSVCSEVFFFFKENFRNRKLEARTDLRANGMKFKVKGQICVELRYQNFNT